MAVTLCKVAYVDWSIGRLEFWIIPWSVERGARFRTETSLPRCGQTHERVGFLEIIHDTSSSPQLCIADEEETLTMI